MIKIGKPPPRTHEVALQRALRPMILQIRRTLPSVRTEADARALGVALRRAWPDAKIRGIVHDIGRKAEAQASRPWAPVDRAIARAARTKSRGDSLARLDAKAYDGKSLIGKWTKLAAAKITSVRDEVAEGLRKDVIAAAKVGMSHEDLAAQWLRQGIPVEWGTAEGRVKVIAQNQLNTLHAQVQSERARAVGVSDFVWRTQGDDRVRARHRELEGTRWKYSEPPGDEGLPGTPINCRCWSESVIPDEMALEIGFQIG